MNIVYGGSFNPPTKAHKGIIDYLFDKFNPENVIVIPVGNTYNKPELLDGNIRLDMLKLLDDRIIVSNIELNKPYNGTYNTLNELKANYNDLYYVVGADNFIYLDKWIKAENLLNEYKFIVFNRGNIDLNSIINEKYLKYKDNFILVDYDDKSSSTEFRLNKNKDLLTDKVYNYIEENNLY